MFYSTILSQTMIYTLDRVFTRSESGTKTIRAIAIDNDLVESDTVELDVTVRLAPPKIDSIQIDRRIDSIFVKDTIRYTLAVSDTNGSLKTLFAAWNGESSPTDSIDINIFKSGPCVVTHVYDTTKSGSRTARFWVRDDDTLLSASKEFNHTIRLGAPVLWGDKNDSLFVVINNGVGGVPYNIHVNNFDTNGVINRFFWDERATFDTLTLASSKKTTTNLFSRDFSAGDLIVPFQMHVYGKDDDGLMRGKRFVIVADSAPPRPSIVSVQSGDSIKILWSGKDFKDGDQTQYSILLKQGTTTPAATDIISNYKAGSLYSVGEYGKDFQISYKNGAHGMEYHYIVISRDARGSISSSLEGSFIFP